MRLQPARAADQRQGGHGDAESTAACRRRTARPPREDVFSASAARRLSSPRCASAVSTCRCSSIGSRVPCAGSGSVGVALAGRFGARSGPRAALQVGPWRRAQEPAAARAPRARRRDPGGPRTRTEPRHQAPRGPPQMTAKDEDRRRACVIRARTRACAPSLLGSRGRSLPARRARSSRRPLQRPPCLLAALPENFRRRRRGRSPPRS